MLTRMRVRGGRRSRISNKNHNFAKAGNAPTELEEEEICVTSSSLSTVNSFFSLSGLSTALVQTIDPSR
jgi:hypothetical protein